MTYTACCAWAHKYVRLSFCAEATRRPVGAAAVFERNEH